MIQIRTSCFETNSSSANVLIIPKSQSIHVPKRFIFMDDDTSSKPIELVIHSIISCYGNERENIDKIVNFLYTSGVEEIIFGGRNPYFEDAINKYKDNPEDMGIPDNWTKEQLKYALFGNYTDAEYCADGESRPNTDPDTGRYIDEDDDNWYREYYAD